MSQNIQEFENLQTAIAFCDSCRFPPKKTIVYQDYTVLSCL